MTKPKSEIDWAAIEKDYRAGSMTNADLAEWYSLKESTLRMRAKRHGWVRSRAGAAQDEGRTIPTPETTSPEVIIGRGRNLTLRLLDELDATTSRVGELREIIDSAVDGSDAKAKDALEKAVSLKERADVLKSLALTAKTLAEAGGVQGKKAERQSKAETAASAGSRFAPRSGPRLVSNNG